jgi:hypothetical protein
MSLCHCVNNRGKRCKLKGRYDGQTHYGISFPTCKHHIDQNPVYRWSENKKNIQEAPKDINDFLEFYRCLVIEHSFKRGIAILMCAQLFRLDIKDSMEKNDLFDLYFNIITSTVKREDSCAVCMDDITHQTILKCGHGFCRECIKTWTYKHVTCPLCREIIS